MNFNLSEKLMQKAFETEHPKIIKTFIVVFLSCLAMVMITVLWLKQFGIFGDLTLGGNDLNVVKSIFFVVGILVSLGQVLFWLLMVGILFIIFRIVIKDRIAVRFRNYITLWGLLLPVKAIVYILLLAGLLSLTNEINNVDQAKQWTTAIERINLISNFAYVSTVIYFLYQHVKKYLLRILFATAFPYLITHGVMIFTK